MINYICPLTERQQQKIEVFEEVVFHLLEWWLEGNPNKKIEDNDLSILKVMKLLFFVAGADQENHLFDVFDFQAWAYGHVEPDVYDYYFATEGNFDRFIINREKVILK